MVYLHESMGKSSYSIEGSMDMVFCYTFIHFYQENLEIASKPHVENISCDLCCSD